MSHHESVRYSGVLAIKAFDEERKTESEGLESFVPERRLGV